MIKVAILIPSFRPELFFRKLLPEICNQISVLNSSNHYYFEIIVLIPDEFNLQALAPINTEPFLRILRTSGSGFSVPRNILWNTASVFDINIFVDDDQVPRAHWLEELLTGIEANPNYSVYFGDIYFEIPENSPNRAFSKLLPKNRLGKERELFEIQCGIANTAFVRRAIPPLVDPFRIDFNDGGEDVSFFESLKKDGCKFYELSGCAVTEEWELNRLQGKELTSRTRRGISAYYKLRMERKNNNWCEYVDSCIVYSRFFVTFLISPALILFLFLNILNPKEVTKIQIRCYIMKIIYVSLFPWKFKIERILGSDTS